MKNRFSMVVSSTRLVTMYVNYPGIDFHMYSNKAVIFIVLTFHQFLSNATAVTVTVKNKV